MVCMCLLAGSCKQGNGYFGWIKGGKCLNQLSDYRHLKNNLVLGVMQIGSVELLNW
jgi:hypothetical protein